MKRKYRVKLQNGRIVGPLTEEQVGELYEKKHINGSEECQMFPAGDWMIFSEHEHLTALVAKLVCDTEVDPSKDEIKIASKTALNISLGSNKEPIPIEVQEFQYSKDGAGESEIGREELEKRFQVTEATKADSDVDLDNDSEKTRVVSERVLVDTDKTVINPEMQKLVAIKDEEEQTEEKEEVAGATEEEKAPEEKKPEIDKNDSTVVANLSEMLPEIQSIAREAEKEFEIKQEQKQAESKEEISEEKSDGESNDNSKTDGKKRDLKRMAVLIAIVAIGGFMFLSDEDKKEGFAPVYVNITFPVTTEYIEAEKSIRELKQGKEAYLKNTYLAKVKAATHFKRSLEFNFKGQKKKDGSRGKNKALALLILTYAELFENAKDKKNASNALFKLIQLSSSKRLTDVNVALGAAIFFKKFGKTHASLSSIEKFLNIARSKDKTTLKKDRPTIKLVGHYLDMLSETGDIVRAKQAYEQLKQVPAHVPVTAISMAGYLRLDQQMDDAEKIIKETFKKHSKSVPLLLEMAKYSLEKRHFDKLERILEKVKKLQAESCPRYLAKYYEYMGILYATKKQNEISVKYFQKALAIFESNELRSKLATLELGGSSAVEQLIVESKVVELIRTSKVALRQRKWDLAFRKSIEATDLMEDYIPAQLHFAELQIKRGHFKSGLATLTKMAKAFPTNTEINYSIIAAFVDAHKLDLANEHIVRVSNSKFKNTAEYASVLAKFYIKKNEFLLARKWLQASLNRDPLNDRDYYLLAEEFLRFREYGKAKSLLKKAIEIDPQNVDYRSGFAKILYELSSADTAIGYMRDVLKDHPDDPKVLGEMAKYYYKEGKVKEFEEYKGRIEQLNIKDVSFYEFLVSASQMEGKIEEVIRYSKELLKIRPGDLDTRMRMGAYFLNQNRTTEGKLIFSEVKKRLSSFPKVNYFLAKICMAENGSNSEALDKCAEMGSTEIKHNPSLEYGHYIVGEVRKRQKKYAKAIRLFEKALSINGKYVEALMSLAWIKYRQNYFEDARTLYDKAIKEMPGNGEARKQLAHVYKSLGQNQLAIEAFGVYLEQNPTASDSAKISREIKMLKR